MPVKCDDVIIIFSVPEHLTYKCGLLFRGHHAGNASSHHEHFRGVLFYLLVRDTEQFEVLFRIPFEGIEIRLVPHLHIPDASAIACGETTDELPPLLRAPGPVKFFQDPSGQPGAKGLQLNALFPIESNQVIKSGPVPFSLFQFGCPPADVFAEHFCSAPGCRHGLAFLVRQRKSLAVDTDAEEKPFRPSRRRAGWFHVTIAEAL